MLIPLLAVAACGGSGSPSNDATPTETETTANLTSLPSDFDIASLVYDNQYSVPPDFYVDERANTTRSYTVHHVLDASASYEVCTDDFAEAQRWEEADNASRSVQGYYVSSDENSRYFEFIRELAYTEDVGNIADVTSPGFARIFKCNNVSRDGVDRNLLDGYSGTIGSRPVTAESLRILTEYLWQFAYFPNARKKVIASTTQEYATGSQQILLLAFATRQGIDKCDLIEVVEWRFEVVFESGVLHRSFVPVRSFEARQENGSALLCD